jgi:hypothetical protein
MELNKLYTNNKRFGGEHYDILDAKLKIFFELCFRVNIKHENYAAIYSVMLKGKAKEFYYQHIIGQNLSFDKMTAKTRAFFHTTKNHQIYLNKWRTTMLKNVIATNSNKTLVQYLELLFIKLQKVYQKLLHNYGNTEGSLVGQFISACQNVEACFQAL